MTLTLAAILRIEASSMYLLDDLASEIDRCITDNRIDDRASPELARLRKRIASWRNLSGRTASYLQPPTTAR
jgi:dsDNA-specific endonuclease/ATPase MutS2